jgi:Ras-related protein Rab-5C
MVPEAEELKLVVVGNSTVGKTCMAKVVTSGEFPEEAIATLGASYVSKLVTVDGCDVRLQIWDTAGQERYRGMTPMYFRGADVGMICYSIADSETFDAVDGWLASLKESAPTDIVVFLVGNKCDLDPVRQVPTETGAEKARDIGATFYEVSARSGDRINDLFIDVAKTYLEKKGGAAPPKQQGVILLSHPTLKKRKGCGC